MTIAATELSVVQYRSFAEYALRLDPHVTVLVGRNAVGKTNLVEALQLLTAGSSFRKPSSAELLRQDAPAGPRARLLLEGEGRRLEMGLELAEGKRFFTRNGKRTTASGVRGVLPSVLFCPDDLDMVKRSASARRGALDSFGVQLNDQYAKLLSTYERTVEQRNNLLRDCPLRICSRSGTSRWPSRAPSCSCTAAPCSRDPRAFRRGVPCDRPA